MGEGAYTGSSFGGFADADGTETVTSWVCDPECPVSHLDLLTTSTTGTRGLPRVLQLDAVNTPFTRGVSAPEYTDSGSPSRFFKHVGGRIPAKPGRTSQR